MNTPVDLDQQRKSGEFRRKMGQRVAWFNGLFMIYIVVMGLYVFLARPALEESPDPMAQTLVGAGDTASMLIMAGFFLVIVFMLASGRLRILLQPNDQVSYVMPAERDANLPASTNVGPSQQTLVLSYLFLYGGLIIGAILIFGLQQFVERTWPELPLWLSRGGIVLPIIALILFLTLGRDWLVFRNSLAPRQLRDLIKTRLLRFVPVGLMGLAVMVVVALAAQGGLPLDLNAILRAVSRWVERYLFFVLIAFIVIGAALYFFALWLVEAELKRGKYDQALRLMDRLGFLMSPPEARLFFRGSILLFAGRSAEAEKLLDESVQRGTTPEHTAFALENRGYARMRQEKYDLAEQDFEQSMKLRPEGHGAYSGLAETLLAQGKDIRRAVELAEHAITNLELLPSARRFSSERRAEYWSVKAWALAVSGIRNDADRALETAFQVAVKDYLPVLALVHCRAARVYALRGEPIKTREMLQRALSLDPVGYAGQIAKRMLGGDLQTAG